MEHYVGLDVSLKLTAICVVDRSGKIEREGVVTSDPETIAAFVKSHAPHVARIGLEAGATSTWLWTELNKMGLPVICIDARHAKAAPPDPALVGDSWRATWLKRLQNVPLFQDNWLQHQRRDAYWKHGSVCEDYAAIQCPVYAVGGWTDGYKNAIQRLLTGLKVPRKGLIGPWAHGYPHFALPGPQIGFLQEILRWWDYWLKGVDTGVMDEPMLRAWMTESVKPASHHDTLPGRWIAEPSWPPQAIMPRRLFLTDEGLRETAGTLAARAACSPQTVGTCSGEWVPFGRGRDQARDQQEDDMRSLVFETTPLDAPIEILGAPMVTLDVASDRPIANLVVRLCDVHPSGESLRVSYGVLNLTHREGHEQPAPLAIGERYRVRIQLNDTGSVFPAGHKVRLAISTVTRSPVQEKARVWRLPRWAGVAGRSSMPAKICTVGVSGLGQIIGQ